MTGTCLAPALVARSITMQNKSVCALLSLIAGLSDAFAGGPILARRVDPHPVRSRLAPPCAVSGSRRGRDADEEFDLEATIEEISSTLKRFSADLGPNLQEFAAEARASAQESAATAIDDVKAAPGKAAALAASAAALGGRAVQAAPGLALDTAGVFIGKGTATMGGKLGLIFLPFWLCIGSLAFDRGLVEFRAQASGEALVAPHRVQRLDLLPPTRRAGAG